MTLQEIKDNYAKEQGYLDWDDLCYYYELDPELSTIDKKENIDRHIDEVCILAQERALENASGLVDQFIGKGYLMNPLIKGAITDKSNLVK